MKITFILPGEEEAARTLKDRLSTRLKLPNIEIPDQHQEFVI